MLGRKRAWRTRGNGGGFGGCCGLKSALRGLGSSRMQRTFSSCCGLESPRSGHGHLHGCALFRWQRSKLEVAEPDLAVMVLEEKVALDFLVEAGNVFEFALRDGGLESVAAAGVLEDFSA